MSRSGADRVFGAFVRRWAAFALVLAASVAISAAQPARAAESVIVIDTENGGILEEAHPGVPWFPASLTKLMTAYTVFKEVRAGRVKMDHDIIVSPYAAAQPPSKIGLKAGTKLSLDVALQAILVRSANDIAVVVAEGVGGSEAGFADLMNKYAAELGMTGSFFVNPHGLPDIRQVTTARDMAILTRALKREFPEYADRFNQKQVEIGTRRYRNRNKILKAFDGADGMKTGFICDSGFNLVASATRNGRSIIAVILGSRSSGTRTVTAKKLLADGFNTPVRRASLLDNTLPSNVRDVFNWDRSTRAPEDMKDVVCKRMGTVRVSRWWQRQKYGVVLARDLTALEAGKIMHKDLLDLRGVISAGKGLVYKEEGDGEYVATIASLDEPQLSKVCSWLARSGRTCETLEPVPPETVKAKIEEIEAAVRRKRAERRARRKKRAAAKKKSK